MGAGSIFFALTPEKAYLSDANAHLVSCYEAVRNNPGLVARHLSGYAEKSGERHYYATRARYNRGRFSAAQASRFIYLNKTCFNGIFRVNRQGKFNVPFGDRRRPDLPSATELRTISDVLAKASLRCRDFESALEEASPGDFLYLDPPYPPLNGIANFRHYTMDRFGDSDQNRLARACDDLDRRGCLWLMSNADLPSIRQLYRKFRMVSLPVTRFVSCKATKAIVNELLITNYL